MNSNGSRGVGATRCLARLRATEKRSGGPFRPERGEVYLRQTKRTKTAMCRNIKTLHNFKPPATDDEVRASALQFVRKLSGFNRPSKVNQAAFDRAVEDVTHAAHHLLEALVTTAPPRDRDVEAAKRKARSAERFGAAGR